MQNQLSMQVLISTMNQKNYSLLDRMNIQSDAVVVNQCDRDGVEEFQYKTYKILWISMSKRGIGLSRNTALFNATADIVLFADDDIVYGDGYEQEVISAFQHENQSDLICFNINLINSNKNIGTHRNNKKNKQLNMFNSMRYGATLIAVRRKSIIRERISFSLLFGGGAIFSCGEDSLFIRDCFKCNLKVFSNVYCLGDVDDSNSSWFKGINEKFFIDKGMIYYLMFKNYHFLIFLYYAFKLSKNTDYNLLKIFKLFCQGKAKIKEYR